MDTVAPASPPLGPSEIARDWAARGYKTSRQYVSKLMREGIGGQKLEGEHVKTLEAAWLWRTARTDFLKSAKGGGVGAAPSTPAAAAAVGAAAPAAAGDSIEAMLERVRGVEMQAFVRWSNAKGYEQAAEAKAYAEASKTRANVESLVAAHLKKVGLVVSLAEAQMLIDERLTPIRAALQGLDSELAKEFFPEDPAKHRRRFRRVVSRVLISSRAVARAKRRLLPALSHHVGDRAA